MVEENKSQEFRLRNIDKTRDYFIEVINQNDLMSKKSKKVFTALNYTVHLLVLASAVIGCVSISAFDFLVDIPISVESYAVKLKFCAITVEIKKYNSIIKKKRKKHNKIVLIAEVKYQRSLNF